MSTIEWSVCALSCFLFAGYILYGVSFAHIGIPLDLLGVTGNIPNQSIKLFVTEIVLLILGLIALPYFLRHRPLLPKDYLFYVLLVFICWGMTRAFLLDSGPLVLRLRNSAFVWYCLAAFVVYYLPVRIQAFESMFRVIYIVVFLLLAGSIIYENVIQNFLPYPPMWSASFGIYPVFAYALLSKSRLSYLVLFFIALALGIGYWAGFQRTSLVGLAATSVFILIFFYSDYRQTLRRIFLLVLLFVVGIFAWPVKRDLTNYVIGTVNAVIDKSKIPKDAKTKDLFFETKAQTVDVKIGGIDFKINNPMQKAISTSGGFEVFRWQMWLDAWKLFTQHPWAGIGFSRQVVYKKHMADMIFVANEGEADKAPISGPHNSYLNALARVGVAGFVLLLVHLIVAVRLLFAGHLAVFSVVVAHALYAVFNVGLEGPVRSLALIFGIGVALKTGRQSGLPEFLRRRKMVDYAEGGYRFFNRFVFDTVTVHRLSVGLVLFVFLSLAGMFTSVYYRTNSETASVFQYLNSDEYSRLSLDERLKYVLDKQQEVLSVQAYYRLAMAAGDILTKQGKHFDASIQYGKAVMRARDSIQERNAIYHQLKTKHFTENYWHNYAGYTLLFRLTDHTYPKRGEIIVQMLEYTIHSCESYYRDPKLTISFLLKTLKKELPHSPEYQRAKEIAHELRKSPKVKECL